MDGHRLVRAVARGSAAALVWGVVSAVLTRLLMRAITIITDGRPEFTLEGTLFIAGMYVVALLPGAMALAYSDARWPWIPFGAGIAFLAYGVVVIGGSSAAQADDLSGGRWVLFVLALVLMVAIYAAQVVLVYRGARRRSDVASAAR